MLTSRFKRVRTQPHGQMVIASLTNARRAARRMAPHLISHRVASLFENLCNLPFLIYLVATSCLRFCTFSFLASSLLPFSCAPLSLSVSLANASPCRVIKFVCVFLLRYSVFGGNRLHHVFCSSFALLRASFLLPLASRSLSCEHISWHSRHDTAS